MRTPVAVGVVCGAYGLGAHLARSFDATPSATLRWICDEGPRVESIGYGPSTAWTTNFVELLEDEELDAIVFASGELAGRGRSLAALGADKHVFVDGPLASTSAEAEQLLATAAQRQRRVMAHMPELLRPGVLRLKRMIDRGELGEIFYVHAQSHVLRGEAALDLFRSPGIETLGVVLDLLGDEPVEAVARAESYLGGDLPDVVLARLGFATGIDAHLHFSCLQGERAERISVVGSEATAVLDASQPEHELSLLVTSPTPGVFEDMTVEQGGRISFRLVADEPLRVGCARFLSAVRTRGEVPYGRHASAALAVVEALQRSSAAGGSTETITPQLGSAAHNVVAFRSH